MIFPGSCTAPAVFPFTVFLPPFVTVEVVGRCKGLADLLLNMLLKALTMRCEGFSYFMGSFTHKQQKTA